MRKLQKNDGWTVKEKLLEKIDFHNLFTQSTGSSEKETSSSNKGTEVEGTEVKGTETEGTEATEKK